VTDDWTRRRREAAAEHAARLEQRQATESARAQQLLDTFAAAALRTGLPTSRLQVTGYGGRGRATSDVTGWYIRQDKAMGVGTDGRLYVLTAPLSLPERLRGIHLDPIAPPLVLGAGGRDGDSIDLVDALERVLPGWQQA
jgi:predicted alpha/beta-hydrolase family hydrolase